MTDNSDIDPFLIEELCKTIALHERFSLEDIRNGYDELRSFDRLMEAIIAAKDHETSLAETIEELLIPTGKVAEIIKKALPIKPSASRSTISLGIDLGFGAKKTKTEPATNRKKAATKTKNDKKSAVSKREPKKLK